LAERDSVDEFLMATCHNFVFEEEKGTIVMIFKVLEGLQSGVTEVKLD
jgi:hypothetical protein